MKRGVQLLAKPFSLLFLLLAFTNIFSQKPSINSRFTYHPDVSGRNKTIITPAMRTGNTLAVTYYVNDNTTAGDHYTSAVGNNGNAGTAAAPFATIQYAIGVAGPGDIIYVDAGTYREDITINKNNISLRGSNYLTNPNTAIRSAESVVQPATTSTDYLNNALHVVMYVDGNVNDVTIDGFLIDGNNDNLSGGTVVGGVDIDASGGIAGLGNPSNIFIRNNILQNYNYGGVDLTPVSGTPALGGITDNKLDNISGYFGFGIYFGNNFYADVSGNVMTQVRIGVQTDNSYLARPIAGTAVISNNTISSELIGIWYNLRYQSASPYNIVNNTLTTFGGSTFSEGLFISSLQQTAEVNLSNNNVSGAAIAIDLWNNPTSNTVTVRGGTLANCSVGICPNNWYGYASDAEPSQYSVSGVTFTNCDTAVWIWDDQRNTNNAAVTLTFANLQSTATGTGTGVIIQGSRAGLAFAGGSPLALATSLTKYIRYTSNGTDVPVGDVNATNVQFGGATGASLSLAQLYTVEDKIDHKIDWNTVGFVTVKAGNDYVTPASFYTPNTTAPKIQRGVDAASATWTVNVQAGTYADNVNVNKTLNLVGPNNGVNPNTGGRLAEAVIVPAVSDTVNGRVIDLNANGIAIKGFTVDGDNTVLGMGSLLNGADINAAIGIGTGVNSSRAGNSDLLIENNILRNLDNNSNNYGAIYGFGSGSSPVNNWQVLNNKIENNSSWGVCAEYNIYGVIRGNSISRSGRGVFMFNYYVPGTNLIIDSNNIRHYFRGMLINNHFGSFGTATIRKNKITTETVGNNEQGAPGARAVNYGIEIWSMVANTGTIQLTDNTITNHTFGTEVWNVAPGVLTQTGDTITNCSTGLYIRTIIGTFGNASNGSHVTATKLNISGSGLRGVWVNDNDTSASPVIAGLNLTNTFISGLDTSIRIQGANVAATINNNSLTGSSTRAINASGYTGASPINAECNWYGSADNTVVASEVLGNVDYVPYLTNGTDNDPVASGFQPVANSCNGPAALYVNDNSNSGDVYTTGLGNNSNPGTPAQPYATIGYAVSVAQPGATIYVDAGTYQEQLVIGKSLSIIGAARSGVSTTKILSPNPLPAQPTANGSARAIVLATGLANTINISKVLVDGAGVGGSNFTGVYYNEASGMFDNSRITGIRNTPFDGAQTGDAFVANHEYDADKAQTVTVTANIIDDYQKSGIVINELNTQGIVTNNTITGQNIKNVIGQNGIQFGFGSYGIITGNSISNNLYNDPTKAFVSTGILLAGVGVNVDVANTPTGKTTTVGNNTLTNNDAGLYADGGGFGYNANAGIVENVNTYAANFIHVSLFAPNTVPNAGNIYDKRVDNPAQTNTVYGQIQRAVDYASAGNTLNASGHVFIEQVEIPINLTLNGAGAGTTFIQSPASLPLSFESNDTNKPVVYVHDAAAVTINNLTVDGAGQGNANIRFVGIGYFNAGGTVQNAEVKDIRNNPLDGAQAGIGILAFANNGTARTLNITTNNIHDFQKNATAFSGANLTVNVNGNTITGAGATAVIAQNGVQISSGATGTVTNNTISGFAYTPATFTSTGVLIFGAGGPVTTSGNTVNDAQAGIYYINSSGTITTNTVNYTPANMGSTPYWYGIDVENGTTSVTKNTVNGGGNGAGIEADYLAGDVTNMTATNNFVNNTDEAFAVYTDGSGGAATVVINENSITNYVTAAIHNYGTTNVNATCNWYGTTNNSVIAPKIIGPVTYVPYLLNGTDNDLVMPGFQAVPGSCTGPTMFFVNDGVTTSDVYTTGVGLDENPGTKEAPFRSINKALSLASTGDAIYVDGGTYAERVVLNQQVKLYGRDTAQNVNTRFAAFVGSKADDTKESVITAPSSNPLGGNTGGPGANDLVRVLIDNVLFDGFTIDGNNTNLGVSTLQENGVNIHARRGITNVDSTGNVNPVNNLNVRYNIIQNVAQRGLSLSAAATALTGNKIDRNLFTAFGADPDGGQGILLLTNAYADVTNNTINVPVNDIGVHLQNFYVNGTMTWSGNNVTVDQDGFGLHANLLYAPSATLNITNNTVNAVNGLTETADGFTWGINIWSVQVGSTVNIQNNTVGAGGGQFARGINLWNNPTTIPITINGGTVGNSVTGINLDNVDPYYGGGGTTVVNVTGTTVTGGTTGVQARAAALTTPPFFAANTVTGSSTINLSNVTINGAVNGVVSNAPAASSPYIARVQFNTPASAITGTTRPVVIDGDDAQVQAGPVNITVPASGANNAIQFQNISNSAIANLILAGGLTVDLNNNAAARAFSSPAGSVVEVTAAWTAPTPTAAGAPNSVLIDGKLWFTAGILNSGGGSIEFGNNAADIMTGARAEKNTSYLLGQALMQPRAVGSGALDMLGVVLPDATGENNADVGTLTIGRTTTTGAINPPYPNNASIKTVWQINPSVTTASRNNVRFRFLDVLRNSQNPNNIFAYRYTAGSWQKISASLTSTRAGDVYTTSLFSTPGFSPWTLSSDIVPAANPDLTPTLTVSNSSFTSQGQTKNAIVNVSEVAGANTFTGNPVTVFIFKSNRFDYSFNGMQTTINVNGTQTINNTDWEVVSDNGSLLQLRTKAGVVINASTASRIGLVITLKTGDNTSGSTNQQITVAPGSGGETNNANNSVFRVFAISL